MDPASDADPAAVMRLPEIIDVEAASQLVGDFLAHRGGPLTLDASGVRRLGGLGLQVLLSAHKTWAEEGAALTLVDPSPAFVDAMELFGATAFAIETARGGASA